MDVLALVTPALQDEVLLSWRMLQRLDVIPKDFPRRRRNTTAQPSEVESRAVSSPREISKEILKVTPKENPKEIPKENPNELSKSIEVLIQENKSVFNTGKQLKTMSGGPMKIKLKDKPIKPLHVNTPRKTPYAYQFFEIIANLEQSFEKG